MLGRTLEQVQRLRIIHQANGVEPTYPYLLKGNNWKHLINRRYPGDMDVASYLLEADMLSIIGTTILSACGCHRPMFPKLERVVMAGMRDSLWTTFPRGYDTEAYHQTIPLALLSLPTVRHYCQSVQVGPLALPSQLQEVKAPLETFTYHAVPGHGPSHFINGLPPIILGAVNRYHFYSNHVVVSMDGQTPLIEEEEIKRIMMIVVAMVKRNSLPVVTNPMSEDQYIKLPTPDISGTSIEFYDLVRHVQIHPPEIGLDYPFLGNGARWLADRPSKCLGVFQSLITESNFGAWSDKTILKHREDAPPCAACGLDQMEEWEHQPVSTGENPSARYFEQL